jgi:hypothetical protein
MLTLTLFAALKNSRNSKYKYMFLSSSSSFLLHAWNLLKKWKRQKCRECDWTSRIATLHHSSIPLSNSRLRRRQMRLKIWRLSCSSRTTRLTAPIVAGCVNGILTSWLRMCTPNNRHPSTAWLHWLGAAGIFKLCLTISLLWPHSQYFYPILCLYCNFRRIFFWTVI